MASKRDAQSTSTGSIRFRGRPVPSPDNRHLDARERQRHEQRDFGHNQAVEAIGDPFAPEEAEIEAEFQRMLAEMR